MTNLSMASRVAGLLKKDGSNLKDINDLIQFVGGVAAYYENVKTVTQKGSGNGFVAGLDPGRLTEVWLFEDETYIFVDGECWDIELPQDTFITDPRRILTTLSCSWEGLRATTRPCRRSFKRAVRTSMELRATLMRSGFLQIQVTSSSMGIAGI